MKVNYEVINKAVQNGIEVLKSIFDYKFPGFVSVKIGKSRTNWASIHKNNKFNTFRLIVSNCYEEIKDDSRAIIRLENTIIHELIHTIPGCMNHGPKFKFYADAVNMRYGNKYHISRCNSMADEGIIKERRPIKYIIECNNCHYQYKYRKTPKWTASYIYEKCWCSKCNVKKTLNLFRVQ